MKLILSVLLVTMVFALAAPAADIAGRWKAEYEMGGNTRTTEFDFKVDGSNLTGTVTGGRGGPAEISEGKLNGDDVSFVVVRKMQDREMKMSYKGKVSGSEIKFTVSMGPDRTFEMTAKKQ